MCETAASGEQRAGAINALHGAAETVVALLTDVAVVALGEEPPAIAVGEERLPDYGAAHVLLCKIGAMLRRMFGLHHVE